MLINRHCTIQQDMKIICVATSDGRAYYSVISRLKRTHLRFISVTPEEALRQTNRLIITTRDEAGLFDGWAVPFEDLDPDPLIMEGQILARMRGEDRGTLLVGVDPGSRIGLAVYYNENELGSLTLNSVEALQRILANIMRVIPHSRAIIKVGNGAPRFSKLLLRVISERVPDATIETVDERGTSTSRLRARGLTRDQEAANKIAFRRGKRIKMAAG